MLTIFQMLNSHRWSVATVVSNVNLEYFHHVPLQIEKVLLENGESSIGQSYPRTLNYVWLHWCCHAVLSRVRLSATPWTVAHPALLSMGFSRKEHWSRLPFPTLGDLPNPGIKPVSLPSPASAGQFFTTVPPGKPHAGLQWVLNYKYSCIAL